MKELLILKLLKDLIQAVNDDDKVLSLAIIGKIADKLVEKIQEQKHL